MTVENNKKLTPALENLLAGKTIGFNAAFARLTGGVLSGIFLSQAIYLETHTQPKTKLTDKDGQVHDFFWHLQEQWDEETGMSRYEQKTARRTLRTMGFLHEVLAQVPAKLFYRVDMEAVAAALADTNKAVPTRESGAHNVTAPVCDGTTNKDVAAPHASMLPGHKDQERILKSKEESMGGDAYASQVACATTLPANALGQTTAITETELAAVETKPAKGRNGKKAAKPKAEPDQRTSHPAIKKYQEVMGKFPKKNDYDSIIQMVGDDVNTWGTALTNLRDRWKKTGGKFYLWHLPYAEEAFQSLAMLSEVPDFDGPNDSVWDVMDALNNDPKLLRKAS